MLMSEARVVIDLKEGVIELEGPIDFVRHYLEMYQPAIKRLNRGVAANQEISKPSSKKSRASKAKRVSCTAAVQKETKAGFFSEPKSTSDIKRRLKEAGFEFSDGNLRNSLKRLTDTGILNADGKGRSVTYSKPRL